MIAVLLVKFQDTGTTLFIELDFFFLLTVFFLLFKADFSIREEPAAL